jgi:hypothetical protein
MGASSGMSVDGVTFRRVPLYLLVVAERVCLTAAVLYDVGPDEVGNSCISSRAGDIEYSSVLFSISSGFNDVRAIVGGDVVDDGETNAGGGGGGGSGGRAS